MTVQEIRLFAVFGLFAIGVVALLASLVVVHLRELARHLNSGEVRGPATASPRDTPPDLARLIDRRQAAWRLRC